MREVDHAAQRGTEKAPEQSGAHEQRFLRAEVFRDIHQVDQIAGLREDALEQALVNRVDAGECRLGNGWALEQIGECPLHAAHAAVEIERFVGAAQDRVILPGEGLLTNAGEIPIFCVGPREALDVGHGFGRLERAAHHLAVDSGPVADFARDDTPDTEQRLQMPIGFHGPRMARRQVDTLVDAQTFPESPVVGTIQVAPQAVGHFGGTPVIARRPIGAAAFENRFPALARCHCTPLIEPWLLLLPEALPRGRPGRVANPPQVAAAPSRSGPELPFLSGRPRSTRR